MQVGKMDDLKVEIRAIQVWCEVIRAITATTIYFEKKNEMK